MMKKLNYWLFEQKGLRHFLSFLTLGYSILFLCSIPLFNIEMLASFIQVNIIVRIVVFFIISLFLALEIEYRQKNIHKSNISKSDIVLSVLGMITSLFIPLNIYIFSISLLYLIKSITTLNRQLQVF